MKNKKKVIKKSDWIEKSLEWCRWTWFIEYVWNFQANVKVTVLSSQYDSHKTYSVPANDTICLRLLSRNRCNWFGVASHSTSVQHFAIYIETSQTFLIDCEGKAVRFFCYLVFALASLFSVVSIYSMWRNQSYCSRAYTIHQYTQTYIPKYTSR